MNRRTLVFILVGAALLLIGATIKSGWLYLVASFLFGIAVVGILATELVEAIDLIRKIRENGATIVIIEHIMRVIMTISDRIHAINFGQTIAEGTPKEVAANPAVIEAYLGTDYA